MISNTLKEVVRHGDLLFPVDVRETKKEPYDENMLYCHWHDEFEFLVVTKGGATIQVNSERYDVYEGECIFINSNSLHCAFSLSDLPFEFYAILAHQNFLDSSLNDIVQQKYLNPIFESEILSCVYINKEAEDKISLLPLLEQIKRIYLYTSIGYELFIKSKLYEVWYKMFTYVSDSLDHQKKATDYKTARIKIVIEYIQTHYIDKITLDDLSNAVNMSSSQFCRFFKQILQMTPIEYVNHYRIQASTQLLETTDKKIAEVALNVGFNNISYFTSTFKKHVGCTPMEYRLSILNH